MTDEERQRLLHKLRRAQESETGDWFLCAEAADEIERLAKELETVENENEHHIRLAFIDAGANPARTWKEEAERLAKDAELWKKLAIQAARPRPLYTEDVTAWLTGKR